MAGSELVIKINGDVKNYKDALKEAEDKTSDLGDMLGDVAKVSAVAFAALTAEIGIAVFAFAKQEAAVNKLNVALQQNGTYSKENSEAIQEYASKLQEASTFGDELILSQVALAKSFGTTDEQAMKLVSAATELSAATGMSLDSAVKNLGKTMGGLTGELGESVPALRGLSVEALKSGAAIDLVLKKFKGSAAAEVKTVDGSFKQLKNTFGDLQEQIGARFAPLVVTTFNKLNDFFKLIQSNKALTDLIVSVVAAGAALSGIITVVVGASLAFLKLKAAMQAAGIATKAMALATKGLVAATGLGLLLVLVTEIYLNWQSVWPRMQATFTAFSNNIGKLGSALADILKGVFTFDSSKIKEGIDKAKEAFVSGYEEYSSIVDEKLREQAAAEDALEREKLANNAEIRKEYAEIEKEERAAAFEELLAENEEYNALLDEQKQLFRDKNSAMANNILANEKQARAKIAQDTLTDQIKFHNQYLVEQQKFGTAYAMINQIMNSEVYKGQRQAFGELAQLSQSSNSTLKGIGKAASIANIIMKTAESAMNIYAGFSTIPFIGPALGVAGAAAAVAFGGEQVGRVVAAQDGGLLTGGIPGVDSIPVLAQRNELVSPAQSFEEVIGSVRASREAAKMREVTGTPKEEDSKTGILVAFDSDQASQVITVKQIEDRALGISQEGRNS